MAGHLSSEDRLKEARSLLAEVQGGEKKKVQHRYLLYTGFFLFNLFIYLFILQTLGWYTLIEI